jgi:hypothetical protein
MAKDFGIQVGSLLIHKETAHPIIITELIERNNRIYISFRSLKDSGFNANAIDLDTLNAEIEAEMFELYSPDKLETLKNLYG